MGDKERGRGPAGHEEKRGGHGNEAQASQGDKHSQDCDPGQGRKGKNAFPAGGSARFSVFHIHREKAEF
jgi:hypothetical protein